MKRIFGEAKGLTVGSGVLMFHTVRWASYGTKGTVLGAAVRRQPGQGVPGIFPSTM